LATGAVLIAIAGVALGDGRAEALVVLLAALVAVLLSGHRSLERSDRVGSGVGSVR
jgi:hypothetical protein